MASIVDLPEVNYLNIIELISMMHCFNEQHQVTKFSLPISKHRSKTIRNARFIQQLK